MLTYKDLRKDLLDYYGTATDPFPAAWGDVIAVQRVDNEELLCMAKEVGFDTSELKE